jgi:hypothetical protein
MVTLPAVRLPAARVIYRRADKMIKKLFNYKSYVLGAGLIVILVTLAQANLDDARLKLGGLLELNDDDVKVGGLYEIGKNGHIKPTPACAPPSQQLLDKYFTKDNPSTFILRNNFGDFFPKLLPQLVAQMVEGIHTLTLKPVSDMEISGKAKINVTYNELLAEAGEGCEFRIRKRFLDNTCVALVHRVIKVGETVLGYAVSEECVLPNLPKKSDYDKGLLKTPSATIKLSGYVSRFKNSMEWLSVNRESFVETVSAE